MPTYSAPNSATPVRPGALPEVDDHTPVNTDAAVAADLARRATAAGAIEPYEIQHGLVVRQRRTDEVLDHLNLEHLRDTPRTPRGAAIHTNPAGFAAYVLRLAGDGTTVWADAPNNRVTAVFNDHESADAGGWRDHTATLRATLDEDWTAWHNQSGKLITQEAFAEFIEEHYSAIDGEAAAGQPAGPSAADMLEIAQTFQAARAASFERATRLQSGDVQLRWKEETTASAGHRGQLEVPTQFALRLAPYEGVDPVRVVALLRYRIRDGELRIGFKLHRADDVLRAAFERLAETVATGLENRVPLYRGTPPNALR